MQLAGMLLINYDVLHWISIFIVCLCNNSNCKKQKTDGFSSSRVYFGRYMVRLYFISRIRTFYPYLQYSSVNNKPFITHKNTECKWHFIVHKNINVAWRVIIVFYGELIYQIVTLSRALNVDIDEYNCFLMVFFLIVHNVININLFHKLYWFIRVFFSFIYYWYALINGEKIVIDY